MKKFLLLVLAAALLVVLSVLLTGYVLPQDHVASRDTAFRSAPVTVFGLVLDVQRYPEWRSDVSRVEVLATDPLRWREYSGGDAITFEVVERRAPTLLRVRIADAGLPFGGTWTYDLQPDGTGTTVRITEHGEVYNPVFRFVSRFVLGHEATIDAFIVDLHRRMP